MKNHHRMDRFWLRHTASVPKGFLRYEVLRLIKEKPMSGAELMTEIEKESEERWKPSPGSIYPLLSWLADNAFIESLAKQEDGQKRYQITAKGEQFLKELVDEKEELQERLRMHAPPGFPGFPGFPPVGFPRLRKQLAQPMRRVMKAFRDIRRVLTKDLSDEKINMLAEFLENLATQIDETTEKIRTD